MQSDKKASIIAQISEARKEMSRCYGPDGFYEARAKVAHLIIQGRQLEIPEEELRKAVDFVQAEIDYESIFGYKRKG